MSYSLRQYQDNFISSLSISVYKNKHVIGQSPGGTGKTKCFLSIAKRATNKGRSVLIITDRLKVFNQIAEESGGVRISDGIKYVEVSDGLLYVASSQTLVRRPKIMESFNKLSLPVLIIWDECHVSTSLKILDTIQNRITIGFTATPDYRIAKHLPDYFNDIVCTEHVQWFIDHNPPYLCDYQHICKESGNQVDSLKKTGGDFNETEQRKFFGTEIHYQELIKDISETTFKKCMLFTASINHAEEVYDRLIKEGFKCSISHSKRNDDNHQLAMFEGLNETNILVSVGSLTTGYDNSEVDLIVLYRATTSLALYLQMLFRADRPKEGMFFRVLDYGSNGKRHKQYNYPHKWDELWKQKPKKENGGVAGIKICPECNSMLFVAATFCKYCKYIFPKAEVGNDVGLNQDITNKKKNLYGRLISQLTPKELSLYANLYDKKSFAARVARKQETLIKGFLSEYANYMGYKPGWFVQQEFMLNNCDYKDYML